MPTTLAPVTVRTRKIEKGTSGARERRSTATNAASSTSAPTIVPMVWAEPQPAVSASSRAKTRAERPSVIVTAPATSKCRLSASDLVSAISVGAIAAARMPIGTFTQSTHSQPTYSVRTPPSSTPAAPPEPATAPQTPSALLRSAPSLKVTATIESAAGERIAAPRPWTARAAITFPELPPRRPARWTRGSRPATEEEEAAEGEHVGVDHPRQAALGEVQGVADRRQRHVDDRSVEDD